MSTYKTQAIVLKQNDYINADRLFYIYTQKQGKVALMVKGGKKIQSKLTPNLQAMAVTNLLIAQGRRFDRLASSQIEQNFSNIKSNFEKIAAAYSLIELVDQLTQNYQADEKIFQLLLNYLEVIDKNKLESIKLRNLINFFSLQFLNLLGYSPQLYNCLYCKKKITPNNNYFYPRKGSLACNDCLPTKTSRIIKISDNAIKILRMAIKEKPVKLIKIKIEKKLSAELENIVEEFLKYHLEKPLNSQDFFKKAIA